MSGLRWRVGAVSAIVLLFGFYAVTNFVPQETRVESPLLRDGLLRLGLDLQGGIHWVLGVKLEVAQEHELGFLRDSLQDRLESDDVPVGPIEVEAGRSEGMRW